MGSRKTQSNFQNFINPCILCPDPDKLVLEILHIPSLHLLLGYKTFYFSYIVNNLFDIQGVVDKLLTELERILGKKWVDDFLQQVLNVIKFSQSCERQIYSNINIPVLRHMQQIIYFFVNLYELFKIIYIFSRLG